MIESDMEQTICKQCGGKNVAVTKHKRITGPPKGIKPHPFRLTTYGYCYNKFVCDCGHEWEERTSL